MTSPIFMSIVGPTGKLLTADANSEASIGKTAQDPFKDWVSILDYNHTAVTPHDVYSGHSKVKLGEECFRATMLLDKTTPELTLAMKNTEVLKEVTFRLYKKNTNGKHERFYTILLEEAVVLSVEAFLHESQNDGTGHLTHRVNIIFGYRKITLNHDTAATTGSHDYSQPDVAD